MTTSVCMKERGKKTIIFFICLSSNQLNKRSMMSLVVSADEEEMIELVLRWFLLNNSRKSIHAESWLDSIRWNFMHNWFHDDNLHVEWQAWHFSVRLQIFAPIIKLMFSIFNIPHLIYQCSGEKYFPCNQSHLIFVDQIREKKMPADDDRPTSSYTWANRCNLKSSIFILLEIFKRDPFRATSSSVVEINLPSNELLTANERYWLIFSDRISFSGSQ